MVQQVALSGVCIVPAAKHNDSQQGRLSKRRAFVVRPLSWRVRRATRAMDQERLYRELRQNSASEQAKAAHPARQHGTSTRIPAAEAFDRVRRDASSAIGMQG